MNLPRVTTKDAIEVYALAIAYVHHAQFNPTAIVNMMHVKEITVGTFHFWWKQRYDNKQDGASPVVVCVYNNKTRSWKVQLPTGEQLTLHDKGNVWELAKEHQLGTAKSSRRATSARSKKNCPSS